MMLEGIGNAFTLDLVRSGIRLATPIILAALGGAICNRAGVLDLALEGKVLMGAFIAILATYYTHLGLSAVMANPGAFQGIAAALYPQRTVIGVIFAAIAGGLLGAVFAFLYLRYDVNLVILAIAINLFIAEMTVFFMRIFLGDVGSWSDPSIEQLPDIPIPGIDGLPVLGPILSGHNAIVYLSWLMSIVIYFILFHTKFGRHIRAVGENRQAAETVGINVARVQFFALVLAGMLAAVGGAFLSVGHLSLFTRNMSAGRGWIAVTAALFALNHPIGVLGAGLFFGFADAIAIRLQTTAGIAGSLVQFLPNVATLLALIIVAARSHVAEALARRMFRARAEREIAEATLPTAAQQPSSGD